MSDDLVERAKESIAVGCGCDRWCETAGECGCEADAKRVIAMTLEEAAAMVERVFDKHVVATAIRALVKETA